MGFGWFDCCRPCIGSGQGLVLPAPPSLGDHHSLKPSLCPRFDHARSIGGQVCNLAQPFLIGTLGCVRMWSESGKDETSCTLSSLSQTNRRMHQGVALSADSTAGWFRSRHEERENRKEFGEFEKQLLT